MTPASRRPAFSPSGPTQVRTSPPNEVPRSLSRARWSNFWTAPPTPGQNHRGNFHKRCLLLVQVSRPGTDRLLSAPDPQLCAGSDDTTNTSSATSGSQRSLHTFCAASHSELFQKHVACIFFFSDAWTCSIPSRIRNPTCKKTLRNTPGEIRYKSPPCKKH